MLILRYSCLNICFIFFEILQDTENKALAWFDRIELVLGLALTSRVSKCKSKNTGFYFFKEDKADVVRTEDLCCYVLHVYTGCYRDNNSLLNKFIKQYFSDTFLC
jgi:hypothetical protein